MRLAHLSQVLAVPLALSIAMAVPDRAEAAKQPTARSAEPGARKARAAAARKAKTARPPRARTRRPSVSTLEGLARRMRHDILMSTTAAGTGHPTSSLSSVELMAGLFFSGELAADLDDPKNPNNDRFILSKGHAAPALYATYAAAGKVSQKELKTLRQLGSRLEGHPTFAFPYTEVPTGSLGQGLSNGVGYALAARQDGLSYRTYVLMGDGEVAEGSVDEAMRLAAYEKLDNLVGIIDINGLGQRGPTLYKKRVGELKAQVASKGWHPIVIDGHSVDQVVAAYAEAKTVKGKPVMILARTVKGKGVSFLENAENQHGKALSAKDNRAALAELGRVDLRQRGRVAKPITLRPKRVQAARAKPMRAFTGPTSVRRAAGEAILRLADAIPEMVVIDPETGNSTFADLFAKAKPERTVQGFIAEQASIGTAVGLMRRGKKPVVFGFAAFLSRAFDQFRMAQYSDPNMLVIGTHAGISIGEDGASQMSLEDIGSFRAFGFASGGKRKNVSVLYPSDAVSADRLVASAARRKGLTYVRATRGDTPIIYSKKERFPIGGSKTLRKSGKDDVTIVAAGITLHEALKAHDLLAAQGIRARVIDLYSIEPIDHATLAKAARETRAIITVEDHRPAGGLGEAVLSSLAEKRGAPVFKLAVRGEPRSGTPSELLAEQGIDAKAIVAQVKAAMR